MAKMEITQHVVDPRDPIAANLYFCKLCSAVTAIPAHKQQAPHACEALREKQIGKYNKCGGNVHRITIA